MQYIENTKYQFCRIISRVLSIQERLLLRNIPTPDPTSAFPVFIVGAPRTGSTILYQALTNTLDVGYADNLVNLFYNSFFTAFLISKMIYGNKPHNNFTSFHGNTQRSGGLHAPSECGAFWYRWLPKDDHYVRFADISESSKEEICMNIRGVLGKLQKPLIFKNLNAGQRMDLLAKIFPESKFILAKRDPLLTAQSIYNAKRKLGLRPDQWWSIKPKNWRELDKMDYAHQIAGQIYYIEKQILSDVKRLDIKYFLTISYKDFAREVSGTIEAVRQFLGDQVEYRPNAQNTSFVFSESQSVPDNVFVELKKAINEYDWEDYSSD